MHAFNDERVDVVAIDAALTRLEKLDAPQSRIVELRYFGGPHARGNRERRRHFAGHVKREWAMARAWLRRELAADDAAHA